jgi:hypothetical protein
MSATVSERAAVKMVDGARSGATRTVDLLGRVRGLEPVVVKLSERTATSAIGATRFATATSVGLLTGLHAFLAVSASVAGGSVVKGFEGVRVGATRIGFLLVQVRGLRSVLLKRSVVESIGVARSGITRTGHLLTRLRAPVAISVSASGQAAGRAVEVARAVAPMIGRAGFAMARAAHLVLQAAARVATEVGRAAVTGGRNSLISLRAWLSTAVAESGRAAGRLIAASRAGVGRLRGPLAQVPALFSRLVARSEGAAAAVIAATWTAGRVVVAPPPHVRPILKVCIGIAGFAIVVAALLAAWPRPWRPDPVMAQREVRRPVERPPVEPATAPSLVQTAAPEPVSAPEPAPVVVSPPDTPRMTMRPRPAETRAEIPEPARRSTASAQRSPTGAVESADTADSTAAIDWLLKGGGGRRRLERP